MSSLVIGPTNVGKSTYIEAKRSEYGSEPVFAFQLENNPVPEVGIIHYNLLYRAPSLSESGPVPTEWNIADDIILKKIIDSGLIEKVHVLVCPISELVSRAEARTVVEHTLTNKGRYNSGFWSDVIKSVDLFALYEMLFEVLDRSGLEYEVITSGLEPIDGRTVFYRSDRVEVHNILRGQFHSIPQKEEVERILSLPGAEYQSVLLPQKKFSTARGYNHVGSGRGGTFSLLRDRSFRGRSVLDIGCALGDMLFRAERYGATRLLGVEMRTGRYDAAVQISRLTHSSATFVCGDFLTIPLTEKYDDVLLLNVIHHVPDFRSFIIKAADTSNDRIVIEYPTFDDPVFRKTINTDFRVGDWPVVGVSSKSVDQTFVFTAAAIVKIVGDAGDFSHRLLDSPIRNREILIFERR